MKNNEVFKKIEEIKKLKNSIEEIMKESVDLWVKNNCEDNLRINYYKTDSKDIILDVGSYDGKWISKFLKYHKKCTAYCYEPSKKFFNLLKDNTKEYDKRVKIFNYGLSNKNIESTIDDDLGLASKVGTGYKKIYLKDIFEEINQHEKIKLLKLNIEGGEYLCITRLIETCLIKKIENIQVQFHPVGSKENTLNLYYEVIKKLSETHKINYYFPFIWENWSLVERV